MDSVKREFFRPGELRAVMLLAALMQRSRVDFDPADWDGLRIAQLRVITSVPEERITVSELAERMGMSDQGCGQFVGQLVASGHLSVVTSEADRRRRLVSRTPAGDRLMQRQGEHLSALEREWAQEVGAERYRAFREVLEALAFGDDRRKREGSEP